MTMSSNIIYWHCNICLYHIYCIYYLLLYGKDERKQLEVIKLIEWTRPKWHARSAEWMNEWMNEWIELADWQLEAEWVTRRWWHQVWVINNGVLDLERLLSPSRVQYITITSTVINLKYACYCHYRHFDPVIVRSVVRGAGTFPFDSS